MRAKITAGIITTAMLAILLLTGPAEAFILGLSILNPEVNKGETISFTASVKMNTDEYLDINYLVLRLSGPMNIACEFLPNGTIVKNCPGITIQQLENATYDYGYGGFTNGNLTYKIILDTTNYFSGTYSTQIEMIIGDELYGESGEDIIIKSKPELEGCSVRAKGDEIFANGSEFGEGRINFYIPLRNADKGKGALTGQKDKDRVSCSFDILEILENNPDYARILVSGKCKVRIDKKNEKTEETAEIYFDKTNNKVSLNSIGNDNLNVDEMEIYFRERC